MLRKNPNMIIIKQDLFLVFVAKTFVQIHILCNFVISNMMMKLGANGRLYKAGSRQCLVSNIALPNTSG